MTPRLAGGRGVEGRAVAVVLAALALTSAVAPPARVCGEAPRMKVVARLFHDGWADVEISVNLTGDEAFAVVPLVGEPDSLIVLDEDGVPLNYSVEGGSLLVASLGSERVLVYYQTPTLAEMVGGVWNVTISPGAVSLIEVHLPNGSAVVGLSEVPELVTPRGGGVVVEFVSDSVWVSYVLPPPISSPPPSRIGEEGIPSAGPGSRTITLALVAAVGLGALTLALAAGRGRRPTSGPLDSTDEAILRGLMDLGGEAYQADLVKALGIPRSTVWRRIRRLAGEGYLELREGERGKIVRLRRPE